MIETKVLNVLKKYDKGNFVLLSTIAAELNMLMKDVYRIMKRLRDEEKVSWLQKSGRQLPDRILKVHVTNKEQ